MTDPSPEAISSTGPNPGYITLHNTMIHNTNSLNGEPHGDSLIPLDASGDNMFQYSAPSPGSSLPISDKIYGFYIFGKGKWKFGGNGEVKSFQGGEIKVHHDSDDVIRIDAEGIYPLSLMPEKH